MPTHPWIRILRPTRKSRLRLICLPHAGAGASIFYPWAEPLRVAEIELRAVQYPGREDRIGEKPLGAWKEMVSAMADAWPALSSGEDTALFGHSLGAILAFELALELRQRERAGNLVHVIVSGRNPPHLPKTVPPVHALSEERFLAEFTARYRAGFPTELLADRDFMALVSPILRADCRVVETYSWSPRPALTLPLTVFGGVEDPWTTPRALSEWRGYTTGCFSLQLFAGDHYFHQSAGTRDQVIAGVCDALTGKSALEQALSFA